ncbi:hypothetical protein L2E82_36462 [Cichorium intybus]|uniref:Uncharacterized protein n=1 Tax=Cichorium intybus TaxID=13427 RepID=A0ACB9BRQ8_CICIN|nr:hypothetical protein L2E82_36462 [Cichorium intybus]
MTESGGLRHFPRNLEIFSIGLNVGVGQWGCGGVDHIIYTNNYIYIFKTRPLQCIRARIRVRIRLTPFSLFTSTSATETRFQTFLSLDPTTTSDQPPSISWAVCCLLHHRDGHLCCLLLHTSVISLLY